MYKQTGKSHFRITRTADASLTPKLAPQKENIKVTGGGSEQLALSDGNFSIELQRQELLKQKEIVDDKLRKLKLAISQAKFSYNKGLAGIDPRLLYKWEATAADLGRKSQEMQREAAALSRIRKAENALFFEGEFIIAAREMLHPDVFDRIENVSRERAFQKLAIRELTKNVRITSRE